MGQNGHLTHSEKQEEALKIRKDEGSPHCTGVAGCPTNGPCPTHQPRSGLRRPSLTASQAAELVQRVQARIQQNQL